MSLITPDSGLIIWMTLIFALVFFILARFGFPVISGMLKDRSTKISESLRLAEEAEQRLKTLAEEQKKLIESARLEQTAILKDAADTRDSIIAKARDDAQTEAARILDNAKTQIAAEKESALNDIRAQVAELSMNIAEKVIRRELSDDKAQKELIDRLFEEMS